MMPPAIDSLMDSPLSNLVRRANQHVPALPISFSCWLAWRPGLFLWRSVTFIQLVPQRRPAVECTLTQTRACSDLTEAAEQNKYYCRNCGFVVYLGDEKLDVIFLFWYKIFGK